MNERKRQNLTGENASVPADLKLRNRRTVLLQFSDNREHTVAEITEKTGISKLTVLKAIQFFCGKGILTSVGKGKSTERGGKKPSCYRFSYDRCTLSITMWPDRLGLTLYRLNHTLVAQAVLRWALPSTPEAAFSFIADYATRFLAQSGMAATDLYGVALSTAGILDYDNLILKFSAQSPGWGDNIPVGAFLRGIFGDKPFYLAENNGKCVGRAVSMSQADDSRRALILFTSWGLSACLSRGGEILNGAHSVIGEIGHMILSPDDPVPCACGGHGCAEQLTSLPRLIQAVSANPPPPESPLFHVPPELVSFDILFAASKQGDRYAREHVRTLAGRFALLLRNASLSFDPELVVFTGDYAGADEYFDACLKERLSKFRYYLRACPFEIHYDQRDLLTLDAEGCAIMMMEHFISRPQLYMEGE